jgi:uncharacterized protein YqfA (UPF0365 family)
MDGKWITFILVFVIIIALAGITYVLPFLHWYIASQADLRISLAELIRLRFKGYSLDVVIENMARAKEHRLDISKDEILRHIDNGGNVTNVINGLVLAREHGIPMTKELAMEADLKKIDLKEGVVQLVERSSNREIR